MSENLLDDLSNYVNNILNDIDFLELYEQIKYSGTYNECKLREVIYMTYYKLIIINPEHKKAPMVMSFINVLDNPESINKWVLLYMVAFLESIQKNRSFENMSGLYC